MTDLLTKEERERLREVPSATPHGRLLDRALSTIDALEAAGERTDAALRLCDASLRDAEKSLADAEADRTALLEVARAAHGLRSQFHDTDLRGQDLEEAQQPWKDRLDEALSALSDHLKDDLKE